MAPRRASKKASAEIPAHEPESVASVPAPADPTPPFVLPAHLQIPDPSTIGNLSVVDRAQLISRLFGMVDVASNVKTYLDKDTRLSPEERKKLLNEMTQIDKVKALIAALKSSSVDSAPAKPAPMSMHDEIRSKTDALKPSKTLPELGLTPAPVAAEPEYVRRVKLGLDPNSLAPKIRKDPACLKVLEDEIGLSGLPTEARTVETCWRCVKANKGTYADLPKTLRKSNPAEWDALAVWCIEHHLGVPASLDDSDTDAVIRATLKIKPDTHLLFYGKQAKARESAAEQFAFDECGAKWPSTDYLINRAPWMTRSRARRAFAEKRYTSIFHLPEEVVPDVAFLERLSQPQGGISTTTVHHHRSRFTAEMWKQAVMNRYVLIDWAPLEVLTEEVLLKCIENGHIYTLDEIPPKCLTPRISEAFTQRDAAIQAKNVKQAQERARLRTSNEAHRNKITDPAALQAIYDKHYAEALSSEIFFHGGSGHHEPALFKSSFKIPRGKVYTGPGVAMYGVEDLARLDAEDPKAHEPLYPVVERKSRATKRTVTESVEESTEAAHPAVAAAVVEPAPKKARTEPDVKAVGLARKRAVKA